MSKYLHAKDLVIRGGVLEDVVGLEDSAIFCIIEILLENARNLTENLRRPFWFSAIGDCLKNIIIIINGQRASESTTFRLRRRCVGLIWGHCHCSCYVIVVLFGY